MPAQYEVVEVIEGVITGFSTKPQQVIGSILLASQHLRML